MGGCRQASWVPAGLAGASAHEPSNHLDRLVTVWWQRVAQRGAGRMRRLTLGLAAGLCRPGALSGVLRRCQTHCIALQEPSKKVVSRAIEQQDQLVEQAKAGTLQPEEPLSSFSAPRG